MKLNIIRTLYLNFKLLPFHKAIKLPILLYGKIKFIRLSGSIKFDTRIKRGIVLLGAHGSDMFPNQTTVIDLAGKIIINGNFIRIGAGSLLRVEKNGTIEFSENCNIGALSLIFSEKNIKIQEGATISWKVQIMDTDTHSLIDLQTKERNIRSKPIYIGRDCWIGNNVIINKGTVLPDATIVSSLSLCNKNYNQIIGNKKGVVLGGIPAIYITENKKRMYDKLSD